MPHPITDSFRAMAMAERTSQVLIALLTLTHSSFGSPLRFASERADVTSRGNVYTATAFDLTLPDDSEKNPTVARLMISNVDRRIMDELRLVSTPIEVAIELVLASDPDTVEVSYPGLLLRHVQATATRIEGDLVLDLFDQEPYPAWRFIPSVYPALFTS